MELLFLAMLVLLMATALGSGFPVAFALPGAAIITISTAAICGYVFAGGDVDAYFFQDGPSQWLSAGVTNLRGVYWEVERDTLIAIPLFIFMGIMLQRSKIAEDLLITMAQLFGPVRGGLGISVVFVGALLAATTGIVGATVVAMGLISLPAMLRNNYSPSLATGTIAASGTLGQIIPPSIVLIILADQLSSASDQASTLRKTLYNDATGELTMPAEYGVTSTSAGEMFLGAMVPGLVLVGLYMLYILVYAFLRPKVAPSVRREGALDADFFFRLSLALVPPLALIFLVLGSILAGVATVNQAGAIGAAGALLMSSYRLTTGSKTSFYPAILALVSLFVIGLVVAYYDTSIKSAAAEANATGILIAIIASAVLLLSLGWSAIRAYRVDNTLQEVMIETAKATSLVFIILLGAAMLTAAFRAFGGEELVRHFLLGLPGGFWAQFFTVMVVIFILGFFLDFIEIAVVVVPIVAPILLADPSANITAVWLGVMIGLNIQTSFLTPPFGFALFYLRGVAPAIVKTISMYKGVIGFIMLQISALFIVAYFPPMVNYLPNRVSYLSDTAPPPRNPNLQFCLEEYVGEKLEETNLPALAGDIQGLDISAIPNELKEDLPAGLESVSEAVALLKEAREAATVVDDNADAYRPIHREVRSIQADMRAIDAQIEGLDTRASRLYGEENEAQKAELEAQIEALEKEHEAVEATIPEQWDERNTEFVALTKAEDLARLKYRRAADDSYAALGEIAAALRTTPDLESLRQGMANAKTTLENGDIEAARLAIADITLSAEDIYDADSIIVDLNTARESLIGGEVVEGAEETAEPIDTSEALGALDTGINTADEQLSWRTAVEPDVAKQIISFEATMADTLGLRSQPKMNRDQALYVASCQSHHRDVSLKF